MIVRYEGLRGLYKGLTPYLVHVSRNTHLALSLASDPGDAQHLSGVPDLRVHGQQIDILWNSTSIITTQVIVLL